MPAKVLLANDITERQAYIKAIEDQNTKLKEISWIQSHIIRAPLTRIMALVPLIQDKQGSQEEQEKMLEYLAISAEELDKVINAITDKTRVVDISGETA